MLHRFRKKGKYMRVQALLLTTAILAAAVTGCGRSSNDRNGQNGQDQTGGNTVQQGEQGTDSKGDEEKNEAAGDVAMGRYMESTTSMTDVIEPYSEIYNLKQLSDGRIVLLGAKSGPLVSKTNGEAWDYEYPGWYKEVREHWLLDFKAAADGTYGVIYMIGDESGEEEIESSYSSVALIVKPDGTRTTVQAPPMEEGRYLSKIWMKDDGRIFVTGYDDIIYEVMEDGSTKEYLTIEKGLPDYVTFVGQIMVMDHFQYDAPMLYDMEKEEYIEDDVLGDFIKEFFPGSGRYNSSSYSRFYFPGEDGILYIVGQAGLYRHVIGGSTIEQVIDGSLSSFNDPSNMISGMIALDNDEFLAYFREGNKLSRFTYDPDVPTVPQYKITAYSLEENDTIRQAMTAYQIANPEVYVEYEVGMGDDSVTREDAIKKVNTQIMAGEGPDVIVLDDMPMDSYMEKGLLLDLNDLITDMGGEETFFGNILDAFRTEDGLYAVPCMFSVPVIAGRPEYLEGATQLKGLADAMERMRGDMPNKGILGYYSEEVILEHFMPTCVPSWTEADGTLDKEALSAFFTQTKRIYDAQISGIDGDTRYKYATSEANNKAEGYNITQSIDEFQYLEDRMQIMKGEVGSAYNYSFLVSLERLEEAEDLLLTTFEGQGGKPFTPKTIMGVNASSSNVEMAEAFLKVLFGEDIQGSSYAFGINRKGFELGSVYELAEPGKEDEPVASLAVMDEEGNYVTFETYWMDEVQKQQLVDWIESRDTAYISDPALEEIICKQGSAYLKGEKGLEDAVDEVMKAMSIYLAE